MNTAVGSYLRATISRITRLTNTVNSLRAQQAPTWAIQLFEKALADIKTAYAENRGPTGTLPLDRPSLEIYPAVDAAFGPNVSTKPMILQWGVLRDFGWGHLRPHGPPQRITANFLQNGVPFVEDVTRILLADINKTTQ